MWLVALVVAAPSKAHLVAITPSSKLIDLCQGSPGYFSMASISQQRGRDNGEGRGGGQKPPVGLRRRHNGPPASSSPGVLGDLGDASRYFQRPRLCTVYFVDNRDADASVLLFSFCFIVRLRCQGSLFLRPFLNSLPPPQKKSQQQHFYYIVDSTFSALSAQKLTLHDTAFQRNNPPTKKKKGEH